jgi:hypothetical protein
MSEKDNNSGENGFGSITLNYDATGASKATNNLGMRAMQERVWDKRDAQHLLVKSPPASGKSRAAMFVGLEKLHTSALLVPRFGTQISQGGASTLTGGLTSIFAPSVQRLVARWKS